MIPAGRYEYEDKVRYAEDVKKSNSSYDWLLKCIIPSDKIRSLQGWSLLLYYDFLLAYDIKSFGRGQTIFKMGKWEN